MALPSTSISKTEFRKNYNVVKILTDKIEIMKQLETFNPTNQAVAFAIKKQHGVTLGDVIVALENVVKRLDKIESRLVSLEENQKKDHELLLKVQENQAKDHDLLARVIKLNNLKH
ncbi:MAG: hypothetical protein MJ223_02395 [Mycoplasmoidaceae bacterium]|nr:hypothetical protein [Mycoplasmoidaceae bacterium]